MKNNNHHQNYRHFGWRNCFSGGCILLFLMFGLLSGCKKEQQENQTAPAAQPAEANAPEAKPEAAEANAPEAKPEANKGDGDTKTAESPAPAEDAAPNAEAPAPADDAAPKTDAPETPKTCEKWGTNPMFADGHVFNYEVHIERAACCDLDKDDPAWECDEDGMCELDKTVKIQCKVSLVQAESYYCSSMIQCDNDAADYPPGLWYIDSNGLYRSEINQKLSLHKQPAPGNCKKTKNIQCAPETLAYEFTEFAEEEPLIPFVKKNIKKDECDDDGIVCTSYSLKHTGTVWKLETSAEGGDSSADNVTLDETRGITAFKTDFSGGSERHIEGKLKK